MAKWKWWFGWVKRIFTSETKEKKPKKWCWSIGRFKMKQHPKLTAPNRTLTEAREEQRKHALTVAIATAAAAEAAVAAAHAAAEVVRLTGGSSSYHYLSKGDRTLAAVKIQSAYRGHLARKALRALKGVVRLQALVRGQVVRRRVFRNLRQLPSNARNQVKIQERSSQTGGEICQLDKTNQSPKKKKKLEEKETKLQPESHSQRTWDCSSHSKEDIEAISLRKQEAIAKRERMKQYSFSHREKKFSHIVEESVPNGRESCRTLGQWLEEEACKHDMLYKPAFQSYVITKELCGTAQVAQKSVKKEDPVEEELSSQFLFPRKSFSHIKKSSLGDDSSMPNSPVFPTYVAVTESAKAKVRSMSTPKQRTGFLDICSNQNEPLKEGLSSWSSHYGATTSPKGNTEVSQQRSQSVNRHCYR